MVIFDDTTHIGNIVISGLTSNHRNAELNYVIAETDYWGKGVASFAIAQMINVAKKEFNLNKLYAGIASGKAIEKNGFVLEGIRKQHLFYCREFFASLEYGLLLKG